MKHESDLSPARFFPRGGAASSPSRHNAGRAEAQHLSAYTRSRVVRENAVDSSALGKTSHRIYDLQGPPHNGPRPDRYFPAQDL
ncbi:hypothetical protein GY45DRAFT_1368995 [Cubamyces sp. BRFM 1775]|nr:hypothetical protein GY45DRAFT_1368995 [Cubamyces sp. BRFM 1775]